MSIELNNFCFGVTLVLFNVMGVLSDTVFLFIVAGVGRCVSEEPVGEPCLYIA